MPNQSTFPFMEGKFRSRFKNVYICDFEYANIGGELLPTSLAIKNINVPNAEVEFIWLRNPDGSVRTNVEQPFEHERHSLMVVFFAEAECSVFHELNWWQPHRLIDLYVEIKNFNNGLLTGKGAFSLESLAKKYDCETNYLEGDKTNLRERHGKNEVTEEELETVKRYNVEDVLVTERLYDFWEKAYDQLFEGGIVWVQALHRGQQARIAAEAGRTGYPVDVAAWDKFLSKFDSILAGVLSKAHETTRCFPGGKFNYLKFRDLVLKHKLELTWSKTARGAFKSDQETLRSYEDIDDFKILKDALYLKGATKLREVPIDRKDNRAKTMFSLFGAKSGRTTPSTSKHIPNMAGCFRPFIRPEPGSAIMCVDYEQQEFAICAALSNDEVMIEAYESGDPYLSLGKKSGLMPEDAVKKHPMRDRFKVVCLMTQYGAGAESMAREMKQPVEVAEMILQVHQRIFNKFWAWQEKMLDRFTYDCSYETCNGWSYKLPKGSTFREWGESEGYSVNTLRNWPVQAAGCEMLRIAMRKVSDAGFNIIGLMHDELIVEGPIVFYDPEYAEAKVRELMEEASKEVIGWRIKTEAQIIMPGERLFVKHDKDLDLFKFFAKEAGFDV